MTTVSEDIRQQIKTLRKRGLSPCLVEFSETSYDRFAEECGLPLMRQVIDHEISIMVCGLPIAVFGGDDVHWVSVRPVELV